MVTPSGDNGRMSKKTAPPNGLREVLERTNLTAAELARRMGIPRQNVYRWASGERTLSPATAKIIAKHIPGVTSLEVLFPTSSNILAPADRRPERKADKLTDGRNLPLRSSLETDNNPPPPLPIWGYVQAGQWLEVGTTMDDDIGDRFSERYPVALDPRYPADCQFGLVVRGTSVDKFARDGDLLICIDYWKLGIAIHDGDLVVVQRRRDHGSLYEVTAKIFERIDGRIRLRPYSNDPRWQSDLEVDELSLLDDQDGEIRIVGKVVWAAAMAPNARR